MSYLVIASNNTNDLHKVKNVTDLVRPLARGDLIINLETGELLVDILETDNKIDFVWQGIAEI